MIKISIDKSLISVQLWESEREISIEAEGEDEFIYHKLLNNKHFDM